MTKAIKRYLMKLGDHIAKKSYMPPGSNMHLNLCESELLLLGFVA